MKSTPSTSFFSMLTLWGRPVASVLAAAAGLAALPAQQVTDPAVVTTYGNACGVGLTAADSILGNGSHAVSFQAIVGANAPALLVLGFEPVDIPLPGGLCHLLADPLAVWFAPANGLGEADFSLALPASTEGHLVAQAATFDAALAMQTSAGSDLVFPGTSPTADPTTQTSYPCYYIQNYVWNYPGDGVGNVTGQIRWPSATCNAADGPPAGRPMVVFLHGNAMSHTDHDYLMAHLARNGFVAVSVANGSYMGGSNEGRAREAISFLNGMYAYWGFNDRLSNDIVFAGHSRGGEAAITAARLLAEQPSLGHIAYDVKSVISIAPTDGGGDNSDPKEHLDGTMSRSFLGLYGSRDPDVRGIRLEDPLLGPENTVFAIYDRAGTESSVEGLLLPANNLTKGLVFAHGATHRGFLDGCNLSEGGTIGCSAHKDLAKAYFNAFLRWHVFGQTAYRAYFDGRAVPTAIRLAGTDVFPEFSDQPRRVLDNFEQNGWSVNTRGGSVVVGAGIAQIAEGELWQLDPSAPHDTRGMRIKWSNAGTAYVGWNIPAANVALVGPARDVSSYDFLSLRVAQDYLDAWNVPGQDQDFYVRLYTGSGWSSMVRISDHGRIPSPDVFLTYPYPYPAGDFTKSAMATVRLPLAEFAGADLTDVQWVYCYFTVPGHTAGSVFVDSLEFGR